jgi:DNA-binding GntR family transcriptional regulator
MIRQPHTQKFNFKVVDALPARKSFGQYVYENLKRAIVRGELDPGSRVVESRVAEALGISRTPVREAIHKLEREGLLSQNPTSGFFVKGLSRADIEETFGIRGVLESYAARLAAIKHRQEELKPLEEKIREYQKYLDLKDMDALPRINTEFHDLLYALSRSPRLIKMIHDLKDQIFRFRQVILKMESMAKISNKDHRLMLQSIRKRDADVVERLVREHILRGRDVVLDEFDMQNRGKGIDS